MKKFIVFIIFIGLLVGGYFLFKKDSQELRCSDGFRFVPSTQKCEPVVEQKKGEIDFSKIEIKIPGTDKKIALQKQGDTTKYTGVSSIEEGKGSENTNQTRASISLDTKELVAYSDSLVLVPFLFESGGSGQFVYVGLFDTTSNTHIDSMFIGDRVSVTSIVVHGEKIKINFKDRLFTESFATEPSIPTQLVLEIKNNSFVEIMKLQNADYADVELKSPLPGARISDTLQIKGAIPGTWYFEAVAQFKIIDSSYNEIAFGTVQALSEWMTTQRVPFEITLTTTTLNYKGKATIIIQSENVQGEEEGEEIGKENVYPY